MSSSGRIANPTNEQFLDFCMQTLDTCNIIFRLASQPSAGLSDETVNTAQAVATAERAQHFFAAGPFSSISMVNIQPILDAITYRGIAKENLKQIESSIKELCRAINQFLDHIQPTETEKNTASSSTASISGQLGLATAEILVENCKTKYHDAIEQIKLSKSDLLTQAVDTKTEARIMVKVILPALQHIYLGDKNEKTLETGFEKFGYTGAAKHTLVRLQSLSPGKRDEKRETVMDINRPKILRIPTHTKNVMSAPPESPEPISPEPESPEPITNGQHRRNNAVDYSDKSGVVDDSYKSEDKKISSPRPGKS